MKKVSILLTSRAAPRTLLLTLCNLLGMCAKPELLEFVVRLDDDDEAYPEYVHLLKGFRTFGVVVKIVVGKGKGYAGLQSYYEDCYRESTGDLLLLFGHEARMLTYGWDDVYRESLKDYCVSPATFSKRGDTYAWAFPCVCRKLCEAIGRFCICTPVVAYDRVFEVYAKLSGLTCAPKVWIYHPAAAFTPGTQRGDMNVWVNQHWAELTAQWNTDARHMWEAAKV